MRLRFLLAAFSLAAAPVAAQRSQPLADGIEAANGTATLRVTALTDNILRVRIARGGGFPEGASWSVPHETRMKSVPVRRTADGFTTGALAVRLDPATLGLTVS